VGLTLFCRHSNTIEVLQKELEFFRKQFETEIEYFKSMAEHERQRAEFAIQAMLEARIGGVQIITQPTPREAAQQETMVEKLLRDSEFMGSGADTE
jgi:hypothetical protein